MNDTRAANSAPETLAGILLRPSADGSVVQHRGRVHLAGGRIVAIDDSDDVPDIVLLPGLVDLHIHWPQGHVRGAFSGQLLPWLRESIWPAEAAFVDADHAKHHGEAFLAQLFASGTCSALLFGPPFLDATVGLLARCPDADVLDGPALMEVNAPDDMVTPVADVLDAIDALPEALRRRVVVSPRFAPNVTANGLLRCARTARESGLFVQSHISENRDEVAWVGQLFPEARDYLDVYDRAGLLGPRTILAHGVHLTDRELARCAASGTVIAHCPSSNEALSSGRMPLERYREHGVDWVLATDVGAGPLISQLDTIRVFLAVHEAAGIGVSACEGLARASVVPGAFLASTNADLLGLGSLEVGAPAHVVAVDDTATVDAAKDSGTAEATLRALVGGPVEGLESLPAAVYRWGRRV